MTGQTRSPQAQEERAQFDQLRTAIKVQLQKQTRSPQAQEERAQSDQQCAAIKVQLQKTKLCQFHMRSTCREGASCRFAHGTKELVQQPDLSKTSMCADFLDGKCTNPHCKYAHSLAEIKTTNLCYKTTQCMWYAVGRCRNGAQCRFAHGEEDCKAPTKKKKEKAPQQQRTKEEPEIPEPGLKTTTGFAGKQTGYMMSIAEQLQASQAYLNFLQMQQATLMGGYPMSDPIGRQFPAPWTMPPTMPGAGYNLYNHYNTAANPLHVMPQSVPQESAGPDSAGVEALCQHIEHLAATIKKLQDKVDTNSGSGSGRSIYSNTTSAVSGNTSNVPSEASETSQDLDG